MKTNTIFGEPCFWPTALGPPAIAVLVGLFSLPFWTEADLTSKEDPMAHQQPYITMSNMDFEMLEYSDGSRPAKRRRKSSSGDTEHPRKGTMKGTKIARMDEESDWVEVRPPAKKVPMKWGHKSHGKQSPKKTTTRATTDKRQGIEKVVIITPKRRWNGKDGKTDNDADSVSTGSRILIPILILMRVLRKHHIKDRSPLERPF